MGPNVVGAEVAGKTREKALLACAQDEERVIPGPRGDEEGAIQPPRGVAERGPGVTVKVDFSVPGVKCPIVSSASSLSLLRSL